MSDTIGYYGKIPTVGDFIHRRLPAEFVSIWDGWLQQLMLASREVLAEGWQEHYLVAPLWRFVLAPGIVGPNAWMGLLMPSVDRVGRYFPLTIAMSLPSNVDPAETFIEAEAWFQQLEGLAAAVLHQQRDLPSWDQDLLALPMPALLLAEMCDDATIPLVKRSAAPLAMPLSGGAAGRFSFSGAVSAFRRPYSLFATGGDAQQRMLLAMEGLPDSRRCCALLDGRWNAHGWQTPEGAAPTAATASAVQPAAVAALAIQAQASAPVSVQAPAPTPPSAPVSPPAPAAASAGALLSDLAPIPGSLLDLTLGVSSCPTPGSLMDLVLAPASEPIPVPAPIAAPAPTPNSASVPAAATPETPVAEAAKPLHPDDTLPLSPRPMPAVASPGA